MEDFATARSCVRTACRWPAAAALSYRYDTRQVWLTDLPGEVSPGFWSLCPHHADTLSPPRRWALVDLRSAAPPRAEPAGRDLVPHEGPGERPGLKPAPGPGRYRALYDDLPRLAEQLRGSERTWTELTLFDWDWVQQDSVSP